MDSLALDILRHLESGPASVRPLLSSHARSSLYRRLGELLQEGLVERDRGEYRLLSAGRAAIADRASAEGSARPSGLAAFDEHVPALKLAPTRVHRAVLALVACAMVARTHRMRASHHPGFVVAGPPMVWKTWTARAACLLAAIDPELFVIQLATESGRSLLVRKGAKGERRSSRAALEQPVVGLDEFLRATPEVRRLVQALLCGELTVPEENELLELRAVPIILLNPREGDELSERVGLDAAMLRRSIVVDLGKVEIPAEIVAEGDARLAKIAVLPGVELREPGCPEWDPQEQVRQRLQVVLSDHGRFARIDLSMLSMLVAAATAWLPPDVALDAVLDAYFTAVETLGWLHADWRRRLAEHPCVRGPDSPPRSASTLPEAVSDLDYLERLGRISEACSRLGLSPDAVAQHALTLERLRALGIGEGDLVRVLKVLGGGTGEPGSAPRSTFERLERCVSLSMAEAELLQRVEELERQVVAAARQLEASRYELEQAVRSARAELHPGPSAGESALARALRIDESEAEAVATHLLVELAGRLVRDEAQQEHPDFGAALVAVVSRARALVRLQEELEELRSRTARTKRELAATEAALARRHDELQRLAFARPPASPSVQFFHGPRSGPWR